MKRYDSYKSTGIDWIGTIPTHWQLIQIKYLISKKGGIQIGPFGSSLKSEFIRNNGYKVYGQENVIRNDFSLGYKFIDSDKFNELAKYELSEGDIIITMMGTTGKCQVVPRLQERGIIDSHLIRIRIDRSVISIPFFVTLVNDSYPVLNNIRIESKGSIMEGLNSTIIKSLLLPVPPIQEQSIISDYLSRKTAEINTLIANKRRLLELYEEERKAIINHAVTKGINSSTKMKESDIDWLGKIPSHWKTKRIKHIVSKVGSGVTPTGGANVYQTSGVPLIRSQNVHFDGLKLDDVAFITEETHNRMNNSKVLPGDVLLNITGASIGRTFYVNRSLGEANVNQHVCILRPTKNVETKYLYFVLRSNIGQEQIQREQTGSGREGLNFEALKNFIIPSIDLKEQHSIVQFIENECHHLDDKSAKTRKLIDLLTEYCGTLISEVMTGKIKVTD